MTRSQTSPQPRQKSPIDQPQAGPSTTRSKKTKRDRVHKAVSTTPTLMAVSKALTRMLLDLPIPLKALNCSTLIINDSFERIAAEKRDTGGTPKVLKEIDQHLLIRDM